VHVTIEKGESRLA